MSPMKKNSPILPITDETTSWPPTPDAPANSKLTPPISWQQRIICYIISAVILIALIATILVVALIVYKVREPTMRVNSIAFANQMGLTKNLTILADVTVTNPNALKFKFNSSTTSLLYKGKLVGLAYGPPGSVGAHKDLRTNVSVEVETAKLMSNPAFLRELQGGALGLETSTKVRGKVKILGVFKHHVDVEMNCTVRVAVATQAILDQHCTQRIWF